MILNEATPELEDPDNRIATLKFPKQWNVMESNYIKSGH